MEEEVKPQLDTHFVGILKAIIKKEPRELRDDEIAFLQARWSYLGKKSREKFNDVVFGKPKKNKNEEKGKPQQPKADPNANQSSPTPPADDENEGNDQAGDIEPDEPKGDPNNPFETVDEDEVDE